jgi:Domain of unknown function (DUF4429)
MAAVIKAKGRGARLSYDGSVVTIHHKGFLARTTDDRGAKRIPIASIEEVRWGSAGSLVNGYISLRLIGATEPRSGFRGTIDAAKDENSVLFTKRHQPDFERIRDQIEADIVAARLVEEGPT